MSQTIVFETTNEEEILSILEKEFQKLPQDGIIFLNAKHNFFPVLKKFQDKYWDNFSWNPLANGIEVWGGELKKIQKGSLSNDSIMLFMGADHFRCDELYAECENALSSGDTIVIQEMFRAFKTSILRHFVMEEEILFPVFEDLTGMRQGPTMAMRMEHEQMKNAVTDMETSLQKKDFKRAGAVGEMLLILMQQHNVKEEGILYPMITNHTLDMHEELLKQLQLAV
ncbi:MAG: hemerythrin domain-containing protein [Leptospiraceae bacterium]|nr:hemerythrin domain-containing protein [Leptospiraceae bacterium]MCP5494387.1 hemerythrin domain-containing protein [Leptospiraceae bacterium]